MTQTVNIKCTNGDKFAVDADPEQTVQDFKDLVEGKSSVPKDQQRLIYKGHVLQDARTLSSYSIEGGQTVILVRGARPRPDVPAQPPAPTSESGASAFPAAAPAAAQFAAPTGAAAPNPFAMPGAAMGMGSGMDFSQMQQQLLQNPEQMQAIMNSPMMQSLMENPEMIQNIFQNNPQFRDIFDRNPELAQVLNDPSLIRQSMQMASNPNLMREMMRTTDRAMSNIEAHPEGFNALRRMYENIQEPMMEAAADMHQPPPTSSSTAPDTQQQTSSSPNAAPLPNPWAPTNPDTAARPTSAAAPNAFANMFAQQPRAAAPTEQGQANPFASLPAGLSPEAISQMMQNPLMHQMTQQLLSDPAQLQAMMNANPATRQMMEANPQMGAMMTNPAMLQAISNPAMLQGMLAAMGRPIGFPPAGAAAPSGSPAANPFASMFTPPPTSTGAAPMTAPILQPELLYREQLSQLNDMGFTDSAANITALLATGGNVPAAIERLLQG